MSEQSIYDFELETRKKEKVPMKSYEGKVLVIVNTATGCGFTPHYKDLESMYEKYHDQGLEIIDVPCNQFKNEAPGTDEEIHSFCQLKYKTQFEQFRKSDVNGPNQLPLFKFLKEKQPFKGFSGVKGFFFSGVVGLVGNKKEDENDVRWNFTKFVVDRKGEVVARFEPTTSMTEVEEFVKKLLENKKIFECILISIIFLFLISG